LIGLFRVPGVEEADKDALGVLILKHALAESAIHARQCEDVFGHAAREQKHAADGPELLEDVQVHDEISFVSC
jgi:hypothetical protein